MNWLRVFRTREVIPGITPILIASLDTNTFLGLPRLLFMIIGFLNIFFSSFLINELIDSDDTDKFNPEREKGITRHGISKKFTFIAFFITSIIGLLILSSLGLFWVALSGFVLLFVYSVPPLRLKSRPILDLLAVTFGFVVLPYVSYFLMVNQPITWQELLILCFFANGFFAIDLVAEGADFLADKTAKLTTTAVFLGEKGNLIAIGVFALISTTTGILSMIITGHWWYTYIIAMVFFLSTAAQWGLKIVKNRNRLHELLRTGERFGIYVSGLGTIIVLVIFLVFWWQKQLLF